MGRWMVDGMSLQPWGSVSARVSQSLAQLGTVPGHTGHREEQGTVPDLSEGAQAKNSFCSSMGGVSIMPGSGKVQPEPSGQFLVGVRGRRSSENCE